MRIFDITLTLRDGLPGWPGDTPYRFDLAWSKAEGRRSTSGRVSTSVHIGTHVDAPYHFDDSGPAVDALGLDPFLGPARVADVRGRAVIRVEDLAALDLAGTPRLLLLTDGWADRSRFPDAIPVLHRDVPGYLEAAGVILLGLDVPSVDALDSKDLPVHHALFRSRIAILESVDLSGVAPGVYELIALPLKLCGGDGSPVRAILRCDGPHG